MSPQELKNINQARKDAGLPPIVIKTRTCCRCGEKFQSAHAGNRICQACKDDEPEFQEGV